MAEATSNLRRLFADICRGYSTARWRDEAIYIKHLSHFEQVDLDGEYQRYFDAAKVRKIPTTEEKLAWLTAQGIWAKKDDADIRMQKDYLDGLRKTKEQLFNKAQLKDLDRQINEVSAKLYEVTHRREVLIDLTCERYAERRMQDYYIYLSFHRDAKLTMPLFARPEFNDLQDEDLDELNGLYYTFLLSFDQLQLRRLAVAPFFMSYFYLSSNAETFFGRPISQLTYYQLNLLSYAIHYKQLYQNNDIPDSTKGDPDKIDESLSKGKAIKAAAAKAAGKGGRQALVGISKEDLEAAGVKTSTGKQSFEEVDNVRQAMEMYGEKG